MNSAAWCPGMPSSFFTTVHPAPTHTASTRVGARNCQPHACCCDLLDCGRGGGGHGALGAGRGAKHGRKKKKQAPGGRQGPACSSASGASPSALCSPRARRSFSHSLRRHALHCSLQQQRVGKQRLCPVFFFFVNRWSCGWGLLVVVQAVRLRVL